MENNMLPLILVGIMLALIIIRCVMHSKRPVRAAFLGLLPGPLALVCVNLTSVYTSVAIPVSVLSLLTSAVLGIPGVTMLLILQRIL